MKFQFTFMLADAKYDRYKISDFSEELEVMSEYFS